MSLSPSFAKKLLHILNGEQIPKGQFVSNINQTMLQEFIEEKTLISQPKGNTSYIYCQNPQHLRDYLREHHGIRDLEGYIRYLENDAATRSDGAQYASNSKAKRIRVFPGFFLKTYADLYGKINGNVISLKPSKGTWIYLVDFEQFRIDDNITIVGVENPETFRFIEQYRHLFTDMQPLFLLRYENNSYIEWLQQIENKYVHFGDFDLSGLALYITEFRSKLGGKRCTYFIPENIKDLIAQSKNRKLYLKQLDDPKVKSANFEEYEELADLAKLIMEYKTTVEQEALMMR